MEILKPNYQVDYKEYRRAHLYGVNGVWYPSVSKVIDIIGGNKTGALMAWAKNTAVDSMRRALTEKVGTSQTVDQSFIDWLAIEAKKEPEKKKDEAADIGNQVHNAIDEYIKTGKIPETLTDMAKKGFDNFMLWFNANDMEFVCGDIAVASVKYGYGGRPDAIAKQKDKYVLLDWKTSNAIRDGYAVQVSLYQQAIKETLSIKCSSAYVVRFSKDSDEVEERQVDIKQALKCGLSTLRLFKSFKEENLWKSK